MIFIIFTKVLFITTIPMDIETMYLG